jgi:ribonuclease T2
VTVFRTLAAALFAAVAAVTPASAGFSDRPGDFDYYALVLSWSPSFCLDGHGSDPQCTAKRPYAFVVHGLWPQYDKGWPSDCGAGREPRVPDKIVADTIDAVPTEKLMNHEWQAHGTCSGLGMRGYFDLTRKLFKGITIPAKYSNLSSPLDVTLPELRTDLLKANPQLKPNMIAVDCGRNGRLKEIHFCYSKDGVPAACGPYRPHHPAARARGWLERRDGCRCDHRKIRPLQEDAQKALVQRPFPARSVGGP